MTNDDVLYAYRLRVLASVRELGSVAATCRVHGIHRSTYYRWKNAVDRFGPEILRPRGRRALSHRQHQVRTWGASGRHEPPTFPSRRINVRWSLTKTRG
jgi:hypothetical protein